LFGLFALSVLAFRPNCLSVFVAVLPRLDRLPIFPEAAMMLARFPLGRGKFRDVLMLRVVPSISLADLVDVDVMVADINAAAVSSFAVDLHGVEADVVPVDFGGEAFLRRAPIRLSVFRRVDTVQTDAMAASALVQNGARVAVLDGNDSAANCAVFNTSIVVASIAEPVIRRDCGGKAKHQGKSNQGT
jgi:hypothetical protein